MIFHFQRVRAQPPPSGERCGFCQPTLKPASVFQRGRDAHYVAVAPTLDGAGKRTCLGRPPTIARQSQRQGQELRFEDNE
jgi:hypothetical protein